MFKIYISNNNILKAGLIPYGYEKFCNNRTNITEFLSYLLFYTIFTNLENCNKYKLFIIQI